MQYTIRDGKLFIYLEGHGNLCASLADLEAGKAVDWSDGKTEARRLWKVGQQLFFAHLLWVDIRWPNHVYTFPWNPAGAKFSEVCKTSEFLAKGNGIPKADVKGE